MAGLRWAERDIFDAALLILELIEGFKPRFWSCDIGGEAVHDLPPQHFFPLFGDEALLRIADTSKDQIEFGSIKLAIGGLQLRIGRNVTCDVGVCETETHLAHALIKSGLPDHFAKHLAIKA